MFTTKKNPVCGFKQMDNVSHPCTQSQGTDRTRITPTRSRPSWPVDLRRHRLVFIIFFSTKKSVTNDGLKDQRFTPQCYTRDFFLNPVVTIFYRNFNDNMSVFFISLYAMTTRLRLITNCFCFPCVCVFFLER